VSCCALANSHTLALRTHIHPHQPFACPSLPFSTRPTIYLAASSLRPQLIPPLLTHRHHHNCHSPPLITTTHHHSPPPLTTTHHHRHHHHSPLTTAITHHSPRPSPTTRYLVEKIIRGRIYDSLYWKESCFALTAETIIDRATELKYVGGVVSGLIKPTPFICLVLKVGGRSSPSCASHDFCAAPITIVMLPCAAKCSRRCMYSADTPLTHACTRAHA
jgi:hypothetical protein